MAFQHNEFDLMNSVLSSSDEVKHNFIPDFGTCIECGEERINEGWCKDCEINAFKVNFKNWTSGNPNIDNFIKHTQLNATGNVDYLEYIEFEQFDLIENTNKVGSFSTLYSAIWMEGPRWNWDEDAEQFSRVGPVKVALKRLNNSRDMSEEYLKKIYKYHSCLQSEGVADFFGVTKDPTSNYMFVMRYYEYGDLYSYIEETQGMLCWRDIVNMIWEISGGIEFLHNNGFIHGNLHGGNLLIENEPDTINTYITDLGLIGPANKRNSTEIYGVLPYIDPEILKGNSPTKSSDVYSFGIIMWTLSVGIRPLCNRAHDLRLATEICLGLRPEIINGAPNVYIQLMKRCWHPDPSKRPTASQICDLLGTWVSAICDDPDPSDLSDQFDLAEEKKFFDMEMNEFTQQQIHYQAFYTSRLIFFPELIDFTKTFCKKKV